MNILEENKERSLKKKKLDATNSETTVSDSKSKKKIQYLCSQLSKLFYGLLFLFTLPLFLEKNGYTYVYLL